MEPDPRPPGRPRRGRNNGERWEQMMQMTQQQLMMQQQQVVTTSIMNHLVQSVGPTQPPPPEASNILFYDFHKLKPPTFLWSPVPLEAQSWLDVMTKSFLVVRCTKEDNVAFYTHMLQGEAENWWKGAKAYMISAGTPMNWENFCIVFLDKYIPMSIRKQKEFECTHLQQRDMPVADYVAKFEEL
ncbi:uncharacterized protein [Cicer arietinum]|uniref:uncharacterized protein n=1 Tax=Cicer arietinum TaxID=3827 RepID=UPI003CC59B9C